MASPARPIQPSGSSERVFFSGMAIAMALAAFIGFARTYYLSAYFGTHATISGGPFTLIVRLHAALFTSWVLLFLTQTSLVATHRVALHRKLGIALGGLAAVMVAAGTAVTLQMARRGGAPPGVDPLMFLAVPLGDMVVFALLLAAALWLRRDKDSHKRLMLLAYASILVAAVARFPGVLPLGPLWFYGLTFVPVLLAGLVYDLATRRRPHPVYLWGGALLIASVPLRLMLSTTSAWRRLAETLVGR